MLEWLSKNKVNVRTDDLTLSNKPDIYILEDDKY